MSGGDLGDPAQGVSCHRLGEGQGIVVMESNRAKVDNFLVGGVPPPPPDFQQKDVAAFSHNGSGGDCGLHTSVGKMDDVLSAWLGPNVGERGVKPPRDQRGQTRHVLFELRVGHHNTAGFGKIRSDFSPPVSIPTCGARKTKLKPKQNPQVFEEKDDLAPAPVRSDP